MSLGKPICRWPGHHHWTAGGIKQNLILWKTNMEGKGLQVNIGKTKVLISGPVLDVFQKSGRDPCGVCLKGVGTSTIFCCGCSSWIHEKGSGIPRRLKSDASVICKWCTGQARPIYSRLMAEVTVGREKLEVAPSFYYIGNYLSAGGGCELATITWCLFAWGNFSELLHVLTSRSFPITCSGIVYNWCVRSTTFHAKGTRDLTLSDLITWNVMIQLWFTRCMGSPPRTKSARRISWRGCSLTIC